MTFRVITEGLTDEAILNRVLGAKLPSNTYRVIAAGGYSSSISLARSFLATGPDRLAVVVDADSIDLRSIALRHERATEALSEVATEDRYCLTLAVPEIEGWFFPTPLAASRVLNRSVTEEEWTEIKRHPREVLLASKGISSVRMDSGYIASFLPNLDVDAVAELPEVKTLLEFLQAPYAAAW